MKISKRGVRNTFLNLSVLFPLVLNNSSLSQQVIISVFCITALFYGDLKLSISKIIFLLLIVISIVLNITHIELKNVLRLVQLVLGFMVFPLAISHTNISVKYLRLGIIYVFVLTILDIFNVNFFFDFRDALYPVDADPWKLAFDHSIIALSNRYGSIFYNPNTLGQSMLLIMLIYLIVRFKQRFTKTDYFFLFCNTFCILVSGSRTAFVIFGVVSFFYFMSFFKNKIKYLFVVILIPILASVLSTTRLLDISNTSGGSMDLKWQILFDYLGSMSTSDILVLAFGWLRLDIQFDNDLGNIIYYLGFLGLLYIIYFYLAQIFSSSLRTVFFYSFLMVSYGATLLINFKFFIFTLIILSLLKRLSQSLKTGSGTVASYELGEMQPQGI